MRRTSALLPEEVRFVRALLGDQPLYRLYFEAALADLARGNDTRTVFIGRSRRGLILGIEFEALAVFTTRGELSEAELGRGRGLATQLARELVAELRARGVRTVLLATSADNVAACRAYENAGFSVSAVRRQLDLAAKSP